MTVMAFQHSMIVWWVAILIASSNYNTWCSDIYAYCDLKIIGDEQGSCTIGVLAVAKKYGSGDFNVVLVCSEGKPGSG